MTSTTPVPESDRIPLIRLTKIELRKFLDTRSGMWLMGVTIALTVLASAGCVVFYDTLAELGNHWSVPVSFVGFAIQLLVPVLAILLVTTEWSQRTALTTFTLVPKRGRIVAAKAAALVIITLAVFTIMMALSAASSWLGGMVHSVTVDWSWSYSQVFGFMVATALGIALAFGFGLALRNSPAAIVLYFAIPNVVGLLGLLGSTVHKVLLWVDLSDASLPLITGEWAHNDGWQLLTASVIWLVLPIAFGTWRHLRAEIS